MTRSELGAEIDPELRYGRRPVAAAEIDPLLIYDRAEQAPPVVVAQAGADVVAELGGVVRRRGRSAVLAPPRVIPAEGLRQAGRDVGVDPGPAEPAGDKGRERGARKVVGAMETDGARLERAVDVPRKVRVSRTRLHRRAVVLIGPLDLDAAQDVRAEVARPAEEQTVPGVRVRVAAALEGVALPFGEHRREVDLAPARALR